MRKTHSLASPKSFAVHDIEASIYGTTLGMSKCVIVAASDDGMNAVVGARETRDVGRRDAPVEQMLIPLAVQGRRVGTLQLENDSPVELDAAQQRFLDAITYYGSLSTACDSLPRPNMRRPCARPTD